MSTLKNDLALFNKLAEVLINEEQQHPVAERIEANQLYNTLVIFWLLLQKQQQIYFLINFLEEDNLKLL